MKKGLFLVAISILFVACTPKNSAFRYFDKGDIETNAVRNTKKADIIKNDAIEVGVFPFKRSSYPFLVKSICSSRFGK